MKWSACPKQKCPALVGKREMTVDKCMGGRKTVNDVLQVRNAPTHFEHEQGSQTADSAPGVAT